MKDRTKGRPLKAESKKTRFIKARIREEEYTSLRSNWESLGLTESDFLRMKVLHQSVVASKINAFELLKQLDAIGSEIGRSGNNINQLARHANFLTRRGMLSSEIIIQFNRLFSDYIFLFREMEKSTRELLRLLKA